MNPRSRVRGALALFVVFVACEETPVPLVRDEAQLLSASEERLLGEHHRLLALDHGIDYRIVTGRGFADLDRAAAEAFAALRVGETKGNAPGGLLLMIDAAADRVRLEVGYALEGTFPDAFVAYVEARQMTPFFRSGRVADGILATTELIVDRAARAKARGDGAGEAWFAGSGGGGAARDAEIGAGYERPVARRTTAVRAGRSPTDALELYLAAMAAHDARPDLPFYTAETRAMLAGWTTTRAQMDHLVESYRRCGTTTERRDGADRLAVLRYPVADRRCAPWFFRREGGDWQLDLTMMQSAIRFGRDNSWRLLPEADHPYGFAFDDWTFDRHGFPSEADR